MIINVESLPPPPLTVKQTAERLGISQPRVRKYIRDGILRAIKLSERQTRVLWQSVRDLEQMGPHASAAQSSTDSDQRPGTSSGQKAEKHIASQLARR